MFSLLGAPALSQFRLDKLLRSLQAVDPRITGVTARFVHFVDASQALEAKRTRTARQIADLRTAARRPGRTAAGSC